MTVSAVQKVPVEIWRMIVNECVLPMPALSLDPVRFSRAPFRSLERWHDENIDDLYRCIWNLRLVCRAWNQLASEFLGKVLWISALDSTDMQLADRLRLAPRAMRIDFKAKGEMAKHLYHDVADEEYRRRQNRLRQEVLTCLRTYKANALIGVSSEMINALSPEGSPPRNNVGALCFIRSALRRVSNATLSRRFPYLQYLNLEHPTSGDIGPDPDDDDVDMDEDESQMVMSFAHLRTLVISSDPDDIYALALAQLPSLANLFLNGGPYTTETLLPGLTAIGQQLTLLSMPIELENEDVMSFTQGMWTVLPRLLYLEWEQWAFVAAPPSLNHPLQYFKQSTIDFSGSWAGSNGLVEVGRAKPNLRTVASHRDFYDVDTVEARLERNPGIDLYLDPEDEAIVVTANELASMGIRFEDVNGRTMDDVKRQPSKRYLDITDLRTGKMYK